MKRTLLTLAFLFTLAAAAFAQDGASITAGVFATTNNVNTITANNIGLSLAGEFKYKRAAVGGEAMGHDGRPARARYFGNYDLLQWRGIQLSGGGGFYRTGTTDGGFGQAGLKYDRFSGWVRYGNKNFVEADAQFAVVSLAHAQIAPFYRYTRQDLDTAPRQLIHTAGLRLVLR